MKKLMVILVIFVATRAMGQNGNVPIKPGDGNQARPAAIVKPDIKPGGGEAFKKVAIQKAPLQNSGAGGGANFKQVDIQKAPLQAGSGGGGGSVQLATGQPGAQPKVVQSTATQTSTATAAAGAQPTTTKSAGQPATGQSGKNVVALPSSVPVKVEQKQ